MSTRAFVAAVHPIARVALCAVTLAFSAVTGAEAQVTVSCKDSSVTSYRWTLEEDNTYQVSPGVSDPDTIAVGIPVPGRVLAPTK